MKKIILILAAAAALTVSCQKENTLVSDDGSAYKFSFSISGNGFATTTKADATSGWTSGESIFIFFKPSGGSLLDRYLTLTYDGSKFVQSGSGITGKVLGSGGKLSAVYVPFLGNGVKPVYNDGSWTIDGGDVYYSCASGVDYTVSQDNVTATISMTIPDGYVQFSVPSSKAAQGDKLLCNMFDAYTCVAMGTDLTFTATKVADGKMSGHSQGDRIYFWGKRNSTSSDNCQFTLESTVTGSDFEKSLAATAVAKNHAYNILFPIYTFELVSTSDATQSFDNTTSTSDTVAIPLKSKLKIDDAPETDAEWIIKSVKVGSADAETVNAKSFTGKGGLSAVQSGSSLKIAAAKRNDTGTGGNPYWTGGNGNWSPADWSSTKATSSAPLDLSRYNFQDETTNNPMTTANCYIIRHAGTYKLPLVYGNGIVNGQTNVQSYAPTMASGGNGTYFLSPFQNHLGAGITSPYIENNAGCSASSAAIVWQDRAEVIKDVKIVSGSDVRYLQFTISQSDICQNNAIVAVKDGSDRIIWSWHIWTTNNPDLLSAPVSVVNHTAMEYRFFPLNSLGWLDSSNFPAKDDVVIVLAQVATGKEVSVTVSQPQVTGQSNGCWYQFGRKDPMPTKDVKAYSKQSAKATLATAICNPSIMYAQSDLWCSSTYYNLWTGRKSATGAIDQDADIVKTVYDPSPAGYKVPASNAFTGFTVDGNGTSAAASLNAEGSFNKGRQFYTKPGKQGGIIFFPATGYRGAEWGEVRDLESGGYYWTAVPYDAGNGYRLGLTSGGYVDPLNHGTSATGHSVRPVQDNPISTSATVTDYTNGSKYNIDL